MAKEEENDFQCLIDNKAPKEKNADIDNETGYYKKAYTELIYKTLYQIFRGEKVSEETNWSRILQKQMDYALRAKVPSVANMVMQFAIKAVPTRVYEKTNIETKEMDEDEIKNMLNINDE